jgi:Holliday junction resolvasome RuvABC endonuclease subunit
MNEQQIKHMIEQFLGWKLPADFHPDGGVSFKADFNEHTAHPMKHVPTGTNLLNYTQAKAMVEHMLDGLPEQEQ